jgi:hypothetical protein
MRKDLVARKGNLPRTCWADKGPNLTAGNSNQGKSCAPCAEASTTEEADAGKPHVRDGAGGAE